MFENTTYNIRQVIFSPFYFALQIQWFKLDRKFNSFVPAGGASTDQSNGERRTGLRGASGQFCLMTRVHNELKAKEKKKRV